MNIWPIWTQKAPKDALRWGIQTSKRGFPKILLCTWTAGCQKFIHYISIMLIMLWTGCFILYVFNDRAEHDVQGVVLTWSIMLDLLYLAEKWIVLWDGMKNHIRPTFKHFPDFRLLFVTWFFIFETILESCLHFMVWMSFVLCRFVYRP